jgi:hypothetical protein
MEGDMTLLVEGKPPLALKPGDSYQIPLDAVPRCASGDKGAKVLRRLHRRARQAARSAGTVKTSLHEDFLDVGKRRSR